MLDLGAFPSVKAKPTAPEECTFSLWNKVTGLPVMNGVEDAMRPSLGINLNFDFYASRFTHAGEI